MDVAGLTQRGSSWPRERACGRGGIRKNCGKVWESRNHPRVESVPGKVSGAWVFRGTRLPVATIFENLEDGMGSEEIMEQFDVTREQVKAVLDFAGRSLEAPARR